MDGSDYNWDAPSKLYIVNGEKDSPCHPGVVHIDDAAGTKPETYDDVKAFIDTHGLNHGDLVRFGYHRDTDTVIVSRVPDTGRMGFTRNPDDSGAGYLTIPAEVLANVRNGPRKYADIISSGTPTINLHLGANDEFITGTLGGQPEEGCQFDVIYIAGALESISVKLPGSTRWHEFLPDDLTLKRLTRLLEEHNRVEGDEDNARLTLRVSLRGEQLTRYKDKHSRPARKYAWLQAVPELPEGWSIEKGMSAGGSTSASWVWKLQGPARELPQVRREVGEFLRGFDFEYTDDAQTL